MIRGVSVLIKWAQHHSFDAFTLAFRHKGTVSYGDVALPADNWHVQLEFQSERWVEYVESAISAGLSSGASLSYFLGDGWEKANIFRASG